MSFLHEILVITSIIITLIIIIIWLHHTVGVIRCIV